MCTCAQPHPVPVASMPTGSLLLATTDTAQMAAIKLEKAASSAFEGQANMQICAMYWASEMGHSWWNVGSERSWPCPMPFARRIFNSLAVAKRAEKYSKEAAQWGSGGSELLCDVQCCGTWLKTTPKHIWQLSRETVRGGRGGQWACEWPGPGPGPGPGDLARTLNRLAVRQPHDRAQTHELARLIYGRHEWSQPASQPGHQLDQNMPGVGPKKTLFRNLKWAADKNGALGRIEQGGRNVVAHRRTCLMALFM